VARRLGPRWRQRPRDHHQQQPHRFQAFGSPRNEKTSASIDGERKTVTALFADIKGSMKLIEDLDPEDARGLVDPALILQQLGREARAGQESAEGVMAL
jgi:hypothetical protein